MTSAIHPQLLALSAGFGHSELTPIHDDKLHQQQLKLYIKRDDLLHPIVSGNKWRKLKYILDHALKLGASTLISMGGAYSNHLHALAFVGKSLGMKTIGYVRGEPPKPLNPTLIDLLDWGMELRFVCRSEYRQLRQCQQYNGLPDQLPDQYWIPEGGASDLALQGVSEIVDEIEIKFDHLLVACGTATTLAGLLGKAPASSQVSGVAALKGAGFLNDEVKRLLHNRTIPCQWRILLDYHFGGFAKSTMALQQFMQQFEARHAVPLEPVYTGKLLYALFDRLDKGYFNPGQTIIVLHTGGLQGARSSSLIDTTLATQS